MELFVGYGVKFKVKSEVKGQIYLYNLYHFSVFEMLVYIKEIKHM